ncbi:MAG: hypothetical protein IKN55_12350 [Oscillospiraceae bacterium]|nr:hypothetical protein [Oscillospiraceae bacterium]
MNRLDKVQLFALLLLSGVWTVLCTPALDGTGGMLGAVLGCGVQLLLCLPLLRESVPEFSRTIQQHRWLGIVYAAYFTIWGSFGFSQLHDAAPAGLHAWSGGAVLLILLTCLYTSTAGLRTAGRAAPFLAVLLLLSVAVLTIGAGKRIIPERLFLQTEGIRSGFLSYLAGSGELAAVWLLLGRIRGSGNPAVLAYLPAKLGLYLLLSCLSIVAGGRLTASQQYPFLTLTALAQPLEGQRADALYLLAFVTLFVMHLTLMTGLAGHCLTLLYPRAERAVPLLLPVMLLLSRIFPGEGLQMAAACCMPVLTAGGVLFAGLRERRRAAV